jgi:uncharacterized NAD(P)/FAD-binding protein YdhS
MSAWAGDPDHFARRFEGEGGERRGFAQRRLFGRYLGDILSDAIASGFTEVVDACAVAATRDGEGWLVSLADGASVSTDALVLAIGNQQPAALPAFGGIGDRYIPNPWGAAARAAVRALAEESGAALLVGTGLTMVDLVLSLDAAGHRGRIVALSRRGLIPRSHGDVEPAPVPAEHLPRSLSGLLRWLRRRGAEVGWRAAIDSLRPHSHELWQGLDATEQRRFLRHTRPWWDVHRHRIAPQVAATVARMVGEGRLQVVAGRIKSVLATPDHLEVGFIRRGAGAEECATFAYAFNCTGPLHAIERSRDPLLRSLLDARRVRPDHLGIGLEVDGTCRAGEHLWAMGPLTKGRYWEIIAVPDIREQAAAVAADIERELDA